MVTVELYDHYSYTGENDRRLVYISRLTFSLCTDDRRVTSGPPVTRTDFPVNEPRWARTSAGTCSPTIGSQGSDRQVT